MLKGTHFSDKICTFGEIFLFFIFFITYKRYVITFSLLKHDYCWLTNFNQLLIENWLKYKNGVSEKFKIGSYISLLSENDNNQLTIVGADTKINTYVVGYIYT